MTREEQIAIASCAYGSRGSSIDFTVGAKWADSHPKSPWISVKDDLPCNHSDLVLTYNDKPFSTKRVMVVTDIHTLFLCEMKKDDDRGWIWNYSTKDKIIYWFPIPEPLKSKTKYRPFETQEECWNEMLKHQPFGWVTDKCKYVHIVCVRQSNIEYSPDEDDNILYSCIMTFSDVLEQGYTFADGTPFGIKKEE